LISALGIFLQQIVFEAGYVGWDSAVLDNNASEVMRSFRLAADPSLALVPNDASGALLDFDALAGRKISFFTKHFTPSYYLFAVFRAGFSRWSAGGLYALSVWVAFASLFVYWTLRGLEFTSVFAAFFTLLLFIGPLGSGSVVNAPHPVTVGITYVAAATCFFVWRRWSCYWVAFVLSIFTQSSIGILLLGASLVILQRDRAVGFATLVLSGLSFIIASIAVDWTVLAEAVVEQRKALEEDAIGLTQSGRLSGPFALVMWLFQHPIDYVGSLLKMELLRHLAVVAGLTFLFIFPSRTGAVVFLMAAHQKLLLILGSRDSLLYQLHWHYSALFVPATLLMIVAWRFNADHRAVIMREFPSSYRSLRCLSFVKMAMMLGITIAAYLTYGQWWGSAHWFSSSKASLRKTQPTAFFDIQGSVVATTARPSTGFAYHNEMFRLDKVFSPHGRWPHVKYAVLPSDYVADEWSNTAIADIALILRATAERRGFICIGSERGYTLWAAAGVPIERKARECDARLTRYIPAEVPQSRRSLNQDSNGWYRRASAEDRTVFYGPYQPLYAAETTDVTVELEFDPQLPDREDTRAILVELRASDGELIQSNSVKRSELNTAPHLIIPRSNLLMRAGYQINVTVEVAADIPAIKLRGIRIVSHDPILEHPMTATLRVREGENRLHALFPAGQYRIVGGTHRPDESQWRPGDSRIVIRGNDFTVQKGRGQARFIATDKRPANERTPYGIVLLQLVSED
jgi:hypothetical protein